jgi:DHA1 family multidrug resistance protein-like MFS transporter
MFENLGNQWALTLLGCLAALLAPVPVVFYFKGAQIRKVSRYTPKLPSKVEPVKSDIEEV